MQDGIPNKSVAPGLYWVTAHPTGGQHVVTSLSRAGVEVSLGSDLDA
jgi:cysteine sulfinate desulfinase/cysteine desulfurase-like protein